MNHRVAILSGSALGLLFAGALAAKTDVSAGPDEDAVALYKRAAAALVVDSSPDTAFEFPSYPPFGEQWTSIAREAWTRNADARALAHLAADRPAMWDGYDVKAANDLCVGLRRLTNNLSDAARYRASLGDPRGTLVALRNIQAIAEHVRPAADAVPSDAETMRALVALGIEGMATRDAMTFAGDLATAAKARGDRELSAATADLVARLLAFADPQPLFEPVKRGLARDRADPQKFETGRTAVNRVVCEARMAAVSLAANQYHAGTGRWPASLDALVPNYLPSVPLDPADEKPLGYVVVPGGLPDGRNRPLVYSREEANEPLAYRTDAPQYGFYTDDGSKQWTRRRAGQFRDLARWAPAGPVVRDETPRLQPLP